jgi:hypothetical protein|tara:strand:- start:143 stop:328 length:186 start_codon:yes stop_codon:yes gene_type:complete
MNITKEMMDAKLLQIAEFEAKWGENTRTRAMKKYCTDEKYRNNVRAFNKASANTIVGYEKY